MALTKEEIGYWDEEQRQCELACTVGRVGDYVSDFGTNKGPLYTTAIDSFNIDTLDTGAMKHLDSKVRVDLIPSEMIEALGRPLTYGATKYDEFNWEKGIPYLTCYAAAMRHLLAWRKGVDIDPESGLRHIEQAMVNIGMIVTQTVRVRGDLDNRPKVEK